MHRALRRVTASAPLLLLCALSVALGGAAERTMQVRTLHSLRDGGTRPLVAYLVVRDRDCESHLDLLRYVQRPSIARATTMGGALVIGSTAAVRESLELLARELPGFPARRATFLERKLLVQLGHRATPVLLVLDARTGAVRFAARAPLTVQQRIRFLAALSAAAVVV
jgi:hypothetical protein